MQNIQPLRSGALLILIFTFLVGISSTNLEAKKTIELVEWDSPAPRVKDLNLNYQVVADMIGGGLMIIVHEPQQIDLWTQGEVKTYQDARFSSLMLVVDKPKEKVKEVILDAAKYSEFMPQIRKAGVSLEDEKHFLASWTQVYNLGPFPLKAKFKWQFTKEDNGDLSLLLHDGDVDAAVSRFEFIELGENKTLLVMHSWQDLDTAKFSFRIMVKSNPDMKTGLPAVAAALLLLQYDERLDGKKDTEVDDINTLPARPEYPLFTDNPDSLAAVKKMATNGTLVFIKETQLINHQGEAKEVIFGSAIRIAEQPVDQYKPLLLNIERMTEYVKEIKEVTMKSLDENNPAAGNNIAVKMKVGLGLFGFKMKSSFDIKPQTEDIRIIDNGKGAMSPMFGANEVHGYTEDGKEYTLGVISQAANVSEDAPYMMRVLNDKLPKFGFMQAIFAVLPQIEKQHVWINKQLATEAQQEK